MTLDSDFRLGDRIVKPLANSVEYRADRDLPEIAEARRHLASTS